MRGTLRGRLWLVLLLSGGSVGACRFGYDERPVLEASAGAGSATGGAGGSVIGGTRGAGDAGELGDGGEAPGTGGTGAGGLIGGAGTGVASGGSSFAGTTGAGSGGDSGDGGVGGAGPSGSGGGAGSPGSGGRGGAGGGAGATGGAGGAGGAGGNAGAAAAAGAGGSTTLPDSALCTPASYGGHDYLLCEELRTWSDANGGCVAAGMRLVRVDDASENQWLFDNAVVAGGRNSQVWLGAWDEPVEAEWRWTDGELFWLGDQAGSAQNALFNDWYATREPNDTYVSDDEDCASLETNSSTPEWFDSMCSLVKGYVCESL